MRANSKLRPLFFGVSLTAGLLDASVVFAQPTANDVERARVSNAVTCVMMQTGIDVCTTGTVRVDHLSCSQEARKRQYICSYIAVFGDTAKILGATAEGRTEIFVQDRRLKWKFLRTSKDPTTLSSYSSSMYPDD